LVQEYGLAERTAEFVSGRLQDHPEGDSRHEHWRAVMAIIQKTRRRKMGAPPPLAPGAAPGAPDLVPADYVAALDLMVGSARA
jgi:hypothetical protein